MYYSIIIIFISIIFSQNIETIKIEGNKKTHEYIILREIKQEVNTEFNETILIEDKNRIYNLGLFSSVDIQIIKNTYLVTVSEMWYIWPFPIIKYDNKSEKISYGGGVAHNNFRGRDTDIVLGTTFGNVKEYFLWYQNPWISGDHNSVEMGLYNQSSDHFIYNILEKDKGFFVEGGFYKGYNNQFNFWINYNSKVMNEIEDSDKDILESEHLSQTDFSYVRLGSQYTYDTRDIYVDPNAGIFFNIGLTGLFGLDDTKNIYEIETHFSIYKNLISSIYEGGSYQGIYLSPVFKYSLFSKFQYSTSELPIFKKEYIGGQDYIRGYSPIPSENSMSNSRELIEVDNFLINTFEVQSTLIKRKEYLDKVEMGIDFVLFADWGVGYNLNKSINFDNSLFGYGAGLRIFIMGAVIKIDYGFNSKSTSQLHLF